MAKPSRRGDRQVEEEIRRLKSLPGVGSSVAEDLIRLGVRSPDDLKGRDPEELYRRLEELEGRPVDRCMLYVLRCAVYAVSEPRPQADKLVWWAWKDP